MELMEAITTQQKVLKPARKQVKPGQVVKSIAAQTGKEYNIWYNKWAGGDREDSYSNKEKAQTRCNIRRDTGLTRACKTGMKYVCLYFARGCCPRGYECEYLHSLPMQSESLPDPSKDCFARDKFADYRDDMGGVGSFGRINRTLYVGRIKETGDGEHTEEVVRRHFSMWGEIERIRVLQHRSVAFVTFANESAAQFAKEAMACQSLDNDEILNVRWATEDPNPEQKVAEHARLEKLGELAIQGKVDSRIVEAMKSIRALEEEAPLEESDDEFDEAPVQDSETNGEEDDLRESKRRKLNGSFNPPLSSTILTGQTLQSLDALAQLKRQNAPTNQRPPATSHRVPGIQGLSQYSSDDE